MDFLRSQNKEIFIISSPRSGTTWLSKILNAHPQIYCTENRLFGEYADLIQDDSADLPRLRVTTDKYVQSFSLHSNLDGLGFSSKKFKRELLRSIIKTIVKFQKKNSGKKYWIDKITPYVGTSSIVADQLDKYFPKSPVVFLVRDGRDVCVSGIMHWLTKRQAHRSYSDFEMQRRNYLIDAVGEQPKRIFTDSEIEEWAHTWNEPLQLIGRFETSRPIHIIKYEEMLTNINDVIADLFKFLNVKINDSVIEECVKAGEFKRMTKGRHIGDDKPGEHVRKGVAGDWENYFGEQDISLFMNIAKDKLRQFNYLK